MKKLLLTIIYLIAFTGMIHAQGWIELGTGINALDANNYISRICADSGGVIYAVGGFTDSLHDTNGNSYVAKWNGTNWSKVGSGTNALFNPGIYSMCTDVNHNLYIAGGFTDINNYFYVAKWNGAEWSEVGIGSNALNANSLINTVCADPYGNIYAAGMFTDSLADTSGHEYVAKWNGTTWSELGTGSNSLNANQYIKSIISDHSGNIYAAGSFFNTSGYYYVAKWNGASWSELGAGSGALNANGNIWTIYADHSGNIYAGGFFTDVSGNYYVAKWDGVSWSELGTGGNALHANDAILSICSDAMGNIFAGGNFSIDGTINVAKWNGALWSPLGIDANALNANGAIFTICTDSNSNVYAAGQFDNSNSVINGHEYVAMYHQVATGFTEQTMCNDQLKISPLPAINIVSIAVSDNLIGTEYTIYNLVGKSLITGYLLSANNSVDISGIPAGIYLLKLANGDHNIAKILKE
jgi:hypothetical protein